MSAKDYGINENWEKGVDFRPIRLTKSIVMIDILRENGAEGSCGECEVYRKEVQVVFSIEGKSQWSSLNKLVCLECFSKMFKDVYKKNRSRILACML